MTAQINDRVFHRKIKFNIVGIAGEGLFEPRVHGIEPAVTCTACWRGYHVGYAIEQGQLMVTDVGIGLAGADGEAARAGTGPMLFGRLPRYEKMAIGWTYDGLREPIRFSGGLLLGEGFIEKLYVHMGFHPAWKYKTVREVIFEEGRVTEDLDRSREMKDLRARLTSEPLQPGLGDGQARIGEWIEKCFSRDYSGMH